MLKCLAVVVALKLPCITVNGCTTHCLLQNTHLVGRQHSEADSWLRWIVENYHADWDVAYFLHNHKSSWHRFQIPTGISNTSYGLANTGCFHSDNEPACTMPGAWDFGPQRPLLVTAAALFNLPVDTLIAKYNLHHHKCCAESLVYKRDLQTTPIIVFATLLRTVQQQPHEPWGWAMERLWPLLFNLALPS